MAKVYFVFGIHNHQPVGNFCGVFEEAFDKCYFPFLQMLKKYPRVKCNVHISGSLYDWIDENRKEFITTLKTLAKSGQIEIVSGGYYEPILPLISDEDKLYQIKRMNEYIKEKFGQTPKGIWCAERIWEPYLARIIHDAELTYTFLDDTHFRYAGLNAKEFIGYYVTEDNFKPVYVFPISKLLRYKIPFSQSYEAIDLLKSFHNPKSDVLITLFDDGEKFGLWPHTFDWVYNKGWLESFFSLLTENFDTIETLTAQEAVNKFSPQGLVYLPTASYEEMGEWVLEPESASLYESLKADLKKSPDYERYMDFLRGGFFRNFYRKYDRLNYMHKRMLYLSELVHKKTTPSKDKKIFEYLFKAQCNCGYWHGIFGGFYLGHIRSAIYENLIRAETEFDKKYAQTQINVSEHDIDLDGNKEVVLKNKKIVCVVSQNGGTLVELSLRDSACNYLNTITRREEAYHKKIREKIRSSTKKTATIHDIVKCKDKDLNRYLIYDSYERRALVDHILNRNMTLSDFNAQKKFYSLSNRHYAYSLKKKEKITVTFHYDEKELGFFKRIEFSKECGVGVTYEFCNNHLLKYHDFGVEFNLSLQSPKDILIDGRPFLVEKSSMLENVSSIEIKDLFKNNSITFSCDESDAWLTPIYSVSSSESGFEKGYQQVSLLFINRVHKDSYALACVFKKL